MTTVTIPRRRGRAAKHAKPVTRAFDAAWRNWRNPYPPVEQFSADEIEAIHGAALRILRDIGIRVLSDEARRIYLDAGMTAGESEVIHFDPELVMDLAGKAPAQVTLMGRGENRAVTIGGRNVGVCTTGGTPNFSDIEGGRRPGTLAALDDLCRVAQAFDVIHMIGPFVEAQDVPPNLRHYAMTRSVLTLTDKVPFVFFRGTQAVADAYEP